MLRRSDNLLLISTNFETKWEAQKKQKNTCGPEKVRVYFFLRLNYFINWKVLKHWLLQPMEYNLNPNMFSLHVYLLTAEAETDILDVTEH